MEYTSDIRRRETIVEINSTLSANYTISQPTGQPVSHINGTLLQNAKRIGTINVDIASNSSYVSLEQFTVLNHADRKTALSAISDHIEAILTEPVEPELPAE